MVLICKSCSEHMLHQYVAFAVSASRGMSFKPFWEGGKVSLGIMHFVLLTCLQVNCLQIEKPRREDIECLCKLVSTIGAPLSVGKLKSFIDPYFQRMEQLSKLPSLEVGISSEIQILGSCSLQPSCTHESCLLIPSTAFGHLVSAST